MGRIPGFLLRHRVHVSPPSGVFGVYGTRVQIRCLVTRQLVAQGKERVERVEVRAAPEAARLLRAGARVALPDGRVGYVQQAMLYEAGGLPTPDHAYAQIDTSAPAAGGGELVVLLRRTKAAKSPRYGTDRYTVQEIPVSAVGVELVESTETRDAGAADSTLTQQVDLTFPPGVEVKATDQVRVRGLVFELTGQPLPEVDGQVQAAFTVRARRITG